MKTLTSLAVWAVLGALGTSAFAQGRPGSGPGQRPADANPPIATMTAAYATAAPFDTNKDGSLDATEQAALSKAIADGKVSLPTPPNGGQPNAQGGAARLAMMYATLAAYDANKDGQIDATEQASIEQAIKDGKLRRPGGQGGRGGPGGPPQQ